MTESLDYDYLTSLAHEQQRRAATTQDRGVDRCATCQHTWHGVACTTTFPALCMCPTSWREAS